MDDPNMFIRTSKTITSIEVLELQYQDRLVVIRVSGKFPPDQACEEIEKIMKVLPPYTRAFIIGERNEDEV